MNRKPIGNSATPNPKAILPKNLTDALGKVSGMSEKTMNDIAAQVQENHRRLNGCVRHEFERMEPWQPLRGRYWCKHCHGEIDAVAFHWWTIGRRDGATPGPT